MGAQAMTAIAPDSLKPEVDRIVARYNNANDEVLRLVYQTVLYQIATEQYSLKLDIKKPQLTPEVCKLLAKTKERSFQPFVVMGADRHAERDRWRARGDKDPARLLQQGGKPEGCESAGRQPGYSGLSQHAIHHAYSRAHSLHRQCGGKMGQVGNNERAAQRATAAY